MTYDFSDAETSLLREALQLAIERIEEVNGELDPDIPRLKALHVKLAPRCQSCGGEGVVHCDDPQCGDSTWDHACGDGVCVQCAGTGLRGEP